MLQTAVSLSVNAAHDPLAVGAAGAVVALVVGAARLVAERSGDLLQLLAAARRRSGSVSAIAPRKSPPMQLACSSTRRLRSSRWSKSS